MGIERSNQIIEQADLIFLLLDAQIINENPTINHFNEYLISLKSKLIMNDKTLKIIPIINKADLLNTEAKQLFTDNKILLCSNIEADGLDPLRTYLLEFFAGFTQEIESGLISNELGSIQTKNLLSSHKYLKNGHRHRIYCFRPCLCQQSSRRNNWQNHY